MSINAILKYGQGRFAQCYPGDSLLLVAQKMASSAVNGLAVIDDSRKLAGIITGHDIIQAIANGNPDLSKEQVFVHMSDKIVTCTPETRLTQALHRMSQRGVQHLIVMENATPVAVLSVKDVLSKMHLNDELEVNVLKDIVVAARSH